ncbi:MAG: hypothetical protein WAX44_04230 [Minisyncoccia bacterium]
MEKEKILNLIKITSNIATVFFIGLIIVGLADDKKINSQNWVVFKSDSEITSKTELAEKVSISTPTKKVSKEIEPCPKSNTDFDCYNDYYKNLVLKKGVPEAMKVLKDEYSKNQYVVAQCHPLTHVIGHAAVSLYPTVSEAFTNGDAYCWSGYYHGVMEEVSERIGLNKIAGELNNICKDIPGKEKYSFDYYNCVHGLGHGVMAVSENNLFNSLKLCDNLVGGWEQSSCYGGVYMENIIIEGQGEHTDYLKPSDPLYPCNSVENKYKSSCYLMQTSYALKVYNQDFSKVFALCRKADTGFEDICWQSLGRDASGSTSSNAEATRAKCYFGENYRERSNCVVGAVKDFISYFHSDIEAKKFCSILTDDLKLVCLDVATAYYKSF